MLEKNKDYLEMRVSSTDCAFTQNASTQISVDGFVYTTYFNLPDPGELYVVISKEKFDQLQASNEAQMKDIEHYRTLANQREKNYKALLEKTGFCNLADLMTYLPKGKTLINIIDGLEDDYISERDKADALQTENEELKRTLHEFDPIPEFKELLKKLYSTDDVEKLEWTLNHVCGGRGSVNGWRAVSSFWQQNYETLSKLVGYSSVEEIQDYLTNEAECDTLYEAVSKLKDQVKYTCDEWYSANSRNNSWKAAAECNSPKELMEKRAALEKEIEVYSRALQEWKEGTGCPSPSAAKTLIESGASWCHAYNEVKNKMRMKDLSIALWKEATGCPSPSSAKTLIEETKNANEKLADTIKSWQEATGYETPEKAMEHLSKLRNERTHIVYLNDPLGVIAKWEKVTGCDRPEDFLKWKTNIEGIMEAWKDETGCEYPGDARRLLEKWQTMTKCETPEAAATWITSYDSACERGNNLAIRVAKWKEATGCKTPGEAETTMRNLRGKIDEMKEFAAIASNWTDRMVED